VPPKGEGNRPVRAIEGLGAVAPSKPPVRPDPGTATSLYDRRPGATVGACQTAPPTVEAGWASEGLGAVAPAKPPARPDLSAATSFCAGALEPPSGRGDYPDVSRAARARRVCARAFVRRAGALCKDVRSVRPSGRGGREGRSAGRPARHVVDAAARMSFCDRPARHVRRLAPTPGLWAALPAVTRGGEARWNPGGEVTRSAPDFRSTPGGVFSGTGAL